MDLGINPGVELDVSIEWLYGIHIGLRGFNKEPKALAYIPIKLERSWEETTKISHSCHSNSDSYVTLNCCNYGNEISSDCTNQ